MTAIYTGAAPDEVWPLVKEHHYSHRMPSNIQHCYCARTSGGLFGDTGDVVAAIVFSIPATRWSENVIELSRLVRVPTYSVPLSQLVAFACRRLKRHDFALAVSFADWTQKHHGGIYQACGWSFGGRRDRSMDGLMVNGTFVPGRSCNSTYGTRSPDKLRAMMPSHRIEPHFDEGKFLYWKAIKTNGRAVARRLGLQSLPYPKPNAAGPLDENAPAFASDVQPVAAAPLFESAS